MMVLPLWPEEWGGEPWGAPSTLELVSLLFPQSGPGPCRLQWGGFVLLNAASLLEGEELVTHAKRPCQGRCILGLLGK